MRKNFVKGNCDARELRRRFVLALFALCSGFGAFVLLGQTAPGAVYLVNLASGRTVPLRGFFDRGPVILNFWATYCEPCRREMPALQKMAARHPGVQLVFISVDPGRDTARVKRFIRKNQITATVLHDTYQAAVEFYVPRLEVPATFFIAAGGRIRYRSVGNRPGLMAELERQLIRANL